MPGRTAKAHRIVSLAPSVTSILVEMGARPYLVGVTRWCPDVAAVAELPQLGDCWTLEPEAVVRLQPTLVVGSMPYKTETVGKLLEAPFPFLAMNPRSLADIYEDIRILGRLVERMRAGEALVARMQRGLAAVARRARAARSRPRVHCEAWSNPRITSPPWVAELVELAGGQMVTPAGQRITDEAVHEARPEVIVLAWAATGDRADAEQERARMAQLRGWSDLAAIRDGRVHVIRDELLNTPGPPLVAGAEALLSILHPTLGARRARLQKRGR